MHKGSCLCGAISFEIEGELPPLSCHCTICRKTSGHYYAGTDVKKAALTIIGEDTITWYQSSSKVRRGLCATCGSPLFFGPPHRDWTSIAMGAFGKPTNTKLALHIFVGDKGDYYEISAGLAQNPQ
jgi:hypothetical protein